MRVDEKLQKAIEALRIQKLHAMQIRVYLAEGMTEYAKNQAEVAAIESTHALAVIDALDE